jgi:hypothetical protein
MSTYRVQGEFQRSCRDPCRPTSNFSFHPYRNNPRSFPKLVQVTPGDSSFQFKLKFGANKKTAKTNKPASH